MTQSTPQTPPPATATQASASGSAPGHRNAAADTEPLLHLHKMSTTAGLGSGEYVAVNVTAVVAVLFGLASVLAKLSIVLVVLPLTGVILSVVALVQIRNSNGTQTGRGLAATGLLLSGLISVYLVIGQAMEISHRRANEAAISGLCEQFGQYLATDQFDQAYDLFDSAFHDRVSRNAFKTHIMVIQHSNSSLPITQAAWNGLAEFATDASGAETAEAVMKLTYRGAPGAVPMQTRLKRSGSGWQIDNIPDMFPKLKGDAAANAAGTGDPQAQ